MIEPPERTEDPWEDPPADALDPRDRDEQLLGLGELDGWELEDDVDDELELEDY